MVKRILLAFPPATISINAWPGVVSRLSRSQRARLGLLEFCEPGEQTFPVPTGLVSSDALGMKSIFLSKIDEHAAASYASFASSGGYQNFRFLALKMLNRVDLSGTFRLLDREVFLQAAALSSFQVLRDRRPDIVVFPVTPHEFLPFVVQKTAEFLGAKALFFQPSPMSYSLIPKTGLDSVAPVPSNHNVPVARSNEAVLDRSFQTLLAGNGPKYMDLQVARDRQVATVRSKIQAFRLSIVWLFIDRFPASQDLTGHTSVPGVLSRLFKLLATRSLVSSLRKRALSIKPWQKQSGPYVVIALHYEPERTSIPEGIPVDFQGDLIPKALKLFPSDTSILVKEHYSQQTSALRGFAGRSPLFYDLLAKMPRTYPINPKEPLGQIIQGAECVITLGGTVALEAVLRGVPVVYYGSPWWAGLPGTVRMTDNLGLEDITAVVLPNEGEVKDFLLHLHRAAMIPGIGGEDVLTTEKKLGPIPDGLISAEADAIVEVILSLDHH